MFKFMYLTIFDVIMDQFKENVYSLENNIFYVQKSEISLKTLKCPFYDHFGRLAAQWTKWTLAPPTFNRIKNINPQS